MGMVIEFMSISDKKIEQLLAYPLLIWKVIAPDDPKMFEDAVNISVKKPNIFSKLFSRKSSRTKSKLPEIDFKMTEESVVMDLEKSWHGIHFILSGSDAEGNPPLDFLLCGGRYIGDIDVGYGPARALTSSELANVNMALEHIDTDEFKSRYNPESMSANNIYPAVWDRKEEYDENLEYMLGYYVAMKDFINDICKKGEGVIITLC